MKFNKTIILVPLVIILVVSLSGCITDDLFKSGQTYESNGVTFQYPDEWQVVNGVAEGTVAAVASKGDSRVSTVIQQVPNELGLDIQSACSNNNKNLVLSPNYVNIQEVQSTVNNHTVILHRYMVNEADGSQKEHVATWMQMSNGQIYVLLYNAPLESYESERSSYDMIVGSFALQGDSSGSGSSLQADIMEKVNNLF